MTAPEDVVLDIWIRARCTKCPEKSPLCSTAEPANDWKRIHLLDHLWWDLEAERKRAQARPATGTGQRP